jgi:hypothetical protein
MTLLIRARKATQGLPGQHLLSQFVQKNEALMLD